MNSVLLLSVLICGVSSFNFSFEPIHKTLPPFLEYISAPNKHEYIAISSNPGFSVNQINNKLKDWAEKADVKDQFSNFLTDFTDTQNHFDQKLSSVMENLQNLKRQVDQALKNGDRTKIQQRDIIDSLRNGNEEEIGFLHYIAKQIGHDYYADELIPKKYYTRPELN